MKPCLFFIAYLVLASIVFASPSNLFVLNKYSISVDAVVSPNCDSSSLTPNALLYCTIRKAAPSLLEHPPLAVYDSFSEGLNPDALRTRFFVHVGNDALQSIATQKSVFRIPSLAEDRKPLPTNNRYSFAQAGEGFSVLFLDHVGEYANAYLFTAESEFSFGLALVDYLLNEGAQFPPIQQGCKISISNEGTAVAFKNCKTSGRDDRLQKPDPSDFKIKKIPSNVKPAPTSFLSFESTVPERLTCGGKPVSPRQGYYIEVYKKQPQRMYLFKDGQLVQDPFRFPIKISAGLNPGDKQKEGDEKTPVGTFCLGASDRFAAGTSLSTKFGPGKIDIGSWGPSNGIWLHGTPNGEEGRLGRPASLGCVRAPNTVMDWLLANVPQGTPIQIFPEEVSPPSSPRVPASLPLSSEPQPAEDQSRIVKVTAAPNGADCPNSASSEDYSGGDYACVYFYLDKKDGAPDKFFDVAFAAYGSIKDGGSCTMARFAASKEGVSYPTGYEDVVAVKRGFFTPEAGSYSGNYVLLLKVNRNNDRAPTGFYLRMFLSKNAEVFKTFDAARGISRSAVGPPLRIGVPDCEQTTPQRTYARDLPVDTPFRDSILANSAAYNLDPELVRRVIAAESSFVPTKVNPVSDASGLMQLMPATASSECNGLSGPKLLEPEANIACGTKYLRKMYDRYAGKTNDEMERIKLMLAAYNAGPGTVDRVGGVPSITETQKYINKILAGYTLPPTALVYGGSSSPADDCSRFEKNPVEGIWSILNPGGRFGLGRRSYGGHTGLDFGSLPIRTPVYSVWPGVVLYAKNTGCGYGNEVAVLTQCKNGRKMVVTYDHLDGFKEGIRQGVAVGAGTHIAFLGNTGAGPACRAKNYPEHLHLMVYSGDSQYDRSGRVFTNSLQNPELFVVGGISSRLA